MAMLENKTKENPKLEQNKLSDGRISLYLEYYFLLKLLKVILSKRNTFYSYSFRQYLYLAVNRIAEFNSYMSNIDIDFFKELCLKHGELRHYKKNEFILHEGDACSFFGFILSGVVKYSCTNRTENKPYNVGFSFPNEFIADYPTCLYGMKSELNIQAIIPCEIYICSSTFLQQKFKENNENQRIARIAAEQMFFQSYSRYLDLFRFTPEERYLQLLKKCPAILQMVSLKEIASYLKITPIHMSRIRRKQSFDNKK